MTTLLVVIYLAGGPAGAPAPPTEAAQLKRRGDSDDTTGIKRRGDA